MGALVESWSGWYRQLRPLAACWHLPAFLLACAGMERKNVGLRLSGVFLAQLDEVRGGVPRETWIRQVLMAEVDRLLKERGS